MATLVITNISSNSIYLSDFYKELLPGSSLTVTRPLNLIGSLSSLQSAKVAGTVSVRVTPDPSEASSGFVSFLQQMHQACRAATNRY